MVPSGRRRKPAETHMSKGLKPQWGQKRLSSPDEAKNKAHVCYPKRNPAGWACQQPRRGCSAEEFSPLIQLNQVAFWEVSAQRRVNLGSLLAGSTANSIPLMNNLKGFLGVPAKERSGPPTIYAEQNTRSKRANRDLHNPMVVEQPLAFLSWLSNDLIKSISADSSS